MIASCFMKSSRRNLFESESEKIQLLPKINEESKIFRNDSQIVNQKVMEKEDEKKVVKELDEEEEYITQPSEPAVPSVLSQISK